MNTLLGLTPSGLFMGLSSTIIYTSELIPCSTQVCVPSATRHNIHNNEVEFCLHNLTVSLPYQTPLFTHLLFQPSTDREPGTGYLAVNICSSRSYAHLTLRDKEGTHSHPPNSIGFSLNIMKDVLNNSDPVTENHDYAQNIVTVVKG